MPSTKTGIVYEKLPFSLSLTELKTYLNKNSFRKDDEIYIHKENPDEYIVKKIRNVGNISIIKRSSNHIIISEDDANNFYKPYKIMHEIREFIVKNRNQKCKNPNIIYFHCKKTKKISAEEIVYNIINTKCYFHEQKKPTEFGKLMLNGNIVGSGDDIFIKLIRKTTLSIFKRRLDEFLKKTTNIYWKNIEIIYHEKKYIFESFPPSKFKNICKGYNVISNINDKSENLNNLNSTSSISSSSSSNNDINNKNSESDYDYMNYI
jgi:hypothetical protein